MSGKKLYFCTADLKLLRRDRGFTVEQFAERIFCSSRTVNRIEAANSTANEQIARMIAQALCCDFEELFISEDKILVDSIRDMIYDPGSSRPDEGESYYLLVVRRMDLLDAAVWGETIPCSQTLRQYRGACLKGYEEQGLVVINNWHEWMHFLYCSTIGKTRGVLISVQCAQENFPYLISGRFLKEAFGGLDAHAIEEMNRRLTGGNEDVVFLGGFHVASVQTIIQVDIREKLYHSIGMSKEKSTGA